MSDTNSYSTLIEAVFAHPRMYTLEGSFAETIAFLKGYTGGISRTNPAADLVVDWGGFQNWLADRMNVGVTEVFDHFLSVYSDDRLRIPEISKLYFEFRMQRTQSTDQIKSAPKGRDRKGPGRPRKQAAVTS